MKSLLFGILSAFFCLGVAASEIDSQGNTPSDMLYCGLEPPRECPTTYLATRAHNPVDRNRLTSEQTDRQWLQLKNISEFQNLYRQQNLTAPDNCWLFKFNSGACAKQIRQALDNYHTASPSQEKVQLVTTENLGGVEEGQLYYLIQPESDKSAGEAPRLVKELLAVLGGAALLFTTRMDDYIGIWLIVSTMMVVILRLPDKKRT